MAAGSGVDHHAGGLVDDGQVVVFVDDVEWNFFGDGAQRRALGCAEHGDALVAAQLQRRLGGFVIDQYFLLGDQLLHPGPAHIQMRCQKLVEALAGVVRFDGEACWVEGHGVHGGG